MTRRIGARIETVTRKIILQKLKERNVNLLTGTEVLRIQEDGVLVRNRDTGEQLLQAGQVVMATGMKPDDSLYEAVRDLGIPIHRIGDCLEPRSAKSAIYEGALIGRKI